MSEDARIQMRVDARKLAAEWCGLLTEAARDLPCDEAIGVFWERVSLEVPEQHRIERQPEPAPIVRPMSDAEARDFGNQLIHFGKHKGSRIDEVDLDYLLWLADSKDDFKEQLRRYVRSQRVQAEQ